MELTQFGRDVKPVRRAPGIRLDRHAAMIAAALALMMVFNVANLPSPLYGIYRTQFQFSEITLTLIFAAYVVGAIAALVFFGRLSDQVGRRQVLFVAIALSALSALLFFLAVDTAMLFPARIVSGFAAALAASTCTAWIADVAPRGDRDWAAPLASGAGVAALALGPLIAGLLAQFAPWPLRLPYMVYIVGLVPPALIVWTIGESVRTPRSWREVSLKPRLGVPADLIGQFVAPAVTAFVSFAVMGFYSSLLPTVIARTLHIENRAVSGTVIFFMFACGVAAIAGLRMLSSRTAMFTALLLLMPGVLLLVAAEKLPSLPVLLLASAIGGAASGLGYRASLQVVNEIAPEDRRAETVSALFVVCYVGISLPVIGVGLLSATTTALTADLTFAVALCVLAIGAAATGWMFGGKRAAAS